MPVVQPSAVARAPGALEQLEQCGLGQGRFRAAYSRLFPRWCKGSFGQVWGGDSEK
jgi:hypothetical protein